jgi:hypothetical protein
MQARPRVRQGRAVPVRIKAESPGGLISTPLSMQRGQEPLANSAPAGGSGKKSLLTPSVTHD